jgi:Family of unknown function (DUF7009)
MKLRLTGNSIRVRLDRRDIERLFDEGHVDDAVRCGPGLAFSYAVRAVPAPRERPRVSYTDGSLTIGPCTTKLALVERRDWTDDAISIHTHVRSGSKQLRSRVGITVR